VVVRSHGRHARQIAIFFHLPAVGVVSDAVPRELSPEKRVAVAETCRGKTRHRRVVSLRARDVRLAEREATGRNRNLFLSVSTPVAPPWREGGLSGPPANIGSVAGRCRNGLRAALRTASPKGCLMALEAAVVVLVVGGLVFAAVPGRGCGRPRRGRLQRSDFRASDGWEG
jgi:hypothetical protein